MSGPPYQSPPSPQPSYTPPPSSPNPALGIISLIAGILSFFPGCIFVLCCWPISVLFSLAAIGTGVPGLILANQGKAGAKGLALTGIILGSISLVMTILFYILYATGIIGESVLQQLQNMENLQNNN